MTARERQLAAENVELKARNARQAEKIESLNKISLLRFNQIKRMQQEIDRHLDDLAAMERANARLVEETIALRAAARPLLTDAEDEAGTRAMVDLEMRGQVW